MYMYVCIDVCVCVCMYTLLMLIRRAVGKSAQVRMLLDNARFNCLAD